MPRGDINGSQIDEESFWTWKNLSINCIFGESWYLIVIDDDVENFRIFGYFFLPFFFG